MTALHWKKYLFLIYCLSITFLSMQQLGYASVTDTSTQTKTETETDTNTETQIETEALPPSPDQPAVKIIHAKLDDRGQVSDFSFMNQEGTIFIDLSKPAGKSSSYAQNPLTTWDLKESEKDNEYRYESCRQRAAENLSLTAAGTSPEKLPSSSSNAPKMPERWQGPGLPVPENEDSIVYPGDKLRGLVINAKSNVTVTATRDSEGASVVKLYKAEGGDGYWEPHYDCLKPGQSIISVYENFNFNVLGFKWTKLVPQEQVTVYCPESECMDIGKSIGMDLKDCPDECHVGSLKQDAGLHCSRPVNIRMNTECGERIKTCYACKQKQEVSPCGEGIYTRESTSGADCNFGCYHKKNKVYTCDENWAGETYVSPEETFCCLCDDLICEVESSSYSVNASDNLNDCFKKPDGRITHRNFGDAFKAAARCAPDGGPSDTIRLLDTRNHKCCISGCYGESCGTRTPGQRLTGQELEDLLRSMGATSMSYACEAYPTNERIYQQSQPKKQPVRYLEKREKCSKIPYACPLYCPLYEEPEFCPEYCPNYTDPEFCPEFCPSFPEPEFCPEYCSKFPAPEFCPEYCPKFPPPDLCPEYCSKFPEAEFCPEYCPSYKKPEFCPMFCPIYTKTCDENNKCPNEKCCDNGVCKQIQCTMSILKPGEGQATVIPYGPSFAMGQDIDVDVKQICAIPGIGCKPYINIKCDCSDCQRGWHGSIQCC